MESKVSGDVFMKLPIFDLIVNRKGEVHCQCSSFDSWTLKLVVNYDQSYPAFKD
jgi:hypothetical protein